MLTASQGWHNVSVACSYYAVFTAMWVALGDPPRRHWEHRGIVDHFARGQWRTPHAPLAHALIRAIRKGYENRLVAHYSAVSLAALESTTSLETAQDVLRLVAQTRHLALEGVL